MPRASNYQDDVGYTERAITSGLGDNNRHARAEKILGKIG
jgi:hypothetical protein